MDIVQEIEEYILNFAQEFLDGKYGFEIGHNKFSLFGFDFFDSMLKGLDFFQHEQDSDSSGYILDQNGLPTSIDWRDSGYVNEIQEQGKFGCCYAFSALAAIEAQYAKISGRLLKLSGIFCVSKI